jgi:tRNA(adenine34) deaminase
VTNGFVGRYSIQLSYWHVIFKRPLSLISNETLIFYCIIPIILVNERALTKRRRLNTHELYMKHALAEAYKAYDDDEVPVGAVIVHEGQIIARAHNQIKMLKDPTAHAEMIAITQAAAHLRSERLIECDLYVTLEPCSMCVGAAVLARLRNMIYGANDPKTGACGSVVDLTKAGLFNHDVEALGGIMEAECRSVLQKFFLSKRC